MARHRPRVQTRGVDRPSKRSAALVRLICALLLAGIAMLPLVGQRGPDSRAYQSPPETLPRIPPAQPLPFSHKIHAVEGIECVRCHPTASKRFEAGLPEPVDCLDCHQTVVPENPTIQKLVQLLAADVVIDWVPVYDSPSYVVFSHRKHVRAGERCQTCHGDVTQYDVLPQEVSINMTACMNCHTQRGVENECFWCHELNGF